MFLVILMGGMICQPDQPPLLELVNASREVAHGNLASGSKASFQRRNAVLTENFNRMIASIQQSHANLIKAYDNTLEGWAKAIAYEITILKPI